MALSMQQLAHPDQIRRMTSQTKYMVNDKLRYVLREERLPVSGVKAELQKRIIDYIEGKAAAGDYAGLNRLYNLICAPRSSSEYSSSIGTNTPPSSLSPTYSSMPRLLYPSNYNTSPYASHSNRITFKDSPFYTIVKPLTTVQELKTRESTRDVAKLNLTLTSDVVELLQDTSHRIMVFCTGDNSQSPFQPSDIAFPHQVELRCNLDEVKANLRGLKNKPGSTRPADITNLIRKKTGYPNEVQLTYALTQKVTPLQQKYFVIVNLVRNQPVEQLVMRLKTGKVISVDRVIQEFTRRAQDADIVATSTVMSLKCPLSTLRIDTPCRSIGCAHNQCFDATSYLQLQEQAPTWTCPVCSKYAPFENLAVDLYVGNILHSTSKDTEQVTIEPRGKWSALNSSEDDARHTNPTPDEDGDDDFVEVRDPRASYLLPQAQFPSPYAQTPPLSSREESLVSSTSRPRKRPASEVVDLTLSDDDEGGGAPLAKVKRSSTSTGTDPRMGGFHEGVMFNLPPLPPTNYSLDFFNI